MATHTFANSGAGIAVLTSDTDIYTCTGSGKQATVHALFLSNIDGTNSVTVTVKVYDASATATATIMKDAVIEVGNTISFDKPINLQENDKIQVSAGATGDVEAFVSILEIT
jgi:hypothetical protein